MERLRCHTICALLLSLVGLSCSGGSRSQPAAVTTPGTEAENTGHQAAPVAATEGAMTLAEAGLTPDWMDPAVDPCTDFYQYACGGFITSAVIPPDRSSWSAIAIASIEIREFLREVLEQAAAAPGTDPGLRSLGDYYSSCMDEASVDAAGITGLQPMFDRISSIKNPTMVPEVLAELHAMEVYPLFSVAAVQDFVDATQVITSLDQDGLGLPDREYYLKDEGNMKSVREAYHAHVVRMFGLAGFDSKAAGRAAADVMRIETALATKQQDKVLRREPRAVYHRVDLAGLVSKSGAFRWKNYFKVLGITSTQITVNDPGYFAFVAKLLVREKPAALRNYLAWQLLAARAPTLGKPFRAEALTLASAVTGVTKEHPRWWQCVEQTDEALGELLAQPYVAAKFAGDSRAQAVELMTSVEQAMRTQLGRLPWMDEATRTAALAKLDKVAALIGYPDSWRAYDFPISRDDFAGNVEAAARFEVRRQLAKIGKPVDRFDWSMTPPTVNAYYDSGLNEIVIPAGILQPPFFHRDFHPAVNFGSTGGGTMGHELTHGFDDEGSQFDGDGNLREWWTSSTRAKFKAATKCVQDQYSAYEAVPGVHVNGELTSGENIADIGGVKLAFQAYHAWRDAQAATVPTTVADWSDDQLFFLAYAQSWCAKERPEKTESRVRTDPHSPPRWRVNGVAADLPSFAEAYSCQAGTPMASANACTVW